ncbi:MAG: hypothetical protein ACYCO0_00105 [Candidatus Micrarchaeaceae archaeon]
MSTIMDRGLSGRSDTPHREAASEDFLKGIIRQNWHGQLDTADRKKGRQLAAEIDAHILNMRSLINAIDYEVFCIPNIVSHSKHMQAEELCRYLRLIESMAIGYSSTLGRDVASLAIIGLTSKAKSASSIEKHYNALSNEIESRLDRCGVMIEKRKRKVERLSAAIKVHQRSFLRFFRKGRIAYLKKRADAGRKRIERLDQEFESINNINLDMRAKVNKD